jgi:hypothetical protein
LGARIKCMCLRGKGKGHHITGHRGPRRGRVVSITPWPLYPRERPGTHCTGGWVGPRTGLDGCEKSRPHWDSIPEPSSP